MRAVTRWIRSASRRTRAFVRFAITDTGEGIPAEKLPAVFERFWQVLGADRRGLGLGLYISRCIVEALGGTIDAESTLGRGSTFHFTLPVAVREGGEAGGGAEAA